MRDVARPTCGRESRPAMARGDARSSGTTGATRQSPQRRNAATPRPDWRKRRSMRMRGIRAHRAVRPAEGENGRHGAASRSPALGQDESPVRVVAALMPMHPRHGGAIRSRGIAGAVLRAVRSLHEAKRLNGATWRRDMTPRRHDATTLRHHDTTTPRHIRSDYSEYPVILAHASTAVPSNAESRPLVCNCERKLARSAERSWYVVASAWP